MKKDGEAPAEEKKPAKKKVEEEANSGYYSKQAAQANVMRDQILHLFEIEHRLITEHLCAGAGTLTDGQSQQQSW